MGVASSKGLVEKEYEELFDHKGKGKHLDFQIFPGDLMVILSNRVNEFGVIKSGDSGKKGASKSKKTSVENFEKDWNIPRELLHIGEKIGSGNFGNVYKGKLKNTVVAIKEAQAEKCSFEEFLKEAEIMKECRHENLVELLAICFDGNNLYIITEFMSKGSLLDYLRGRQGQRLQLKDLMYIARQVANGMSFLESKSIIHRDLAARNVLIGDDNIAKVADFGLARLIEGDSKMYQVSKAVPLPWKWTAPEGFNDLFSSKSDVWSFGVLLIEIITKGEEPFPGVSDQQQIIEGYRQPQPCDCPDDLYNIILSCWEKDPGDRPTFVKLCKELRKLE